MSYYDDLGIRPSATNAEIESAYRRLAQKLHPDRNPNKKAQAEAQFKKLQEIYELLKNPVSRAKYDELLETVQSERSNSQSPTSTSIGAASTGRREQPKHAPGPSAAPPVESVGSVKHIWQHKHFLPLAGALLLLVIAAIATVANRPPSAAEIKAAEEVDAAARLTAMKNEEELRALEKEAAKRREAAALLTAQLKRAEDAGQKVLTQLDILRREVGEWDANVATLLTNDKGKYIAASEDHVRVFEEILRKPRPTKQDIDAIEERVKVLITPIKSELAKSEPVLEPSESITQELTNELAAVDKLIKEVREPKQEAESLLAAAEQSGKANSLTLAQAGAELRAKTKRDEGEKQAAAARESEMRLKVARDEEEKRRVENEKAKLAAEAQASMKKAEDEKLHAELVRKAQSSKTKSLLAFFLQPGHLQADLSETAEKRPFSLSKLEARSCLERSPEGQARLLHCLVTTYEKERAIWKDTPYVSDLSPAKRAKLEEMQSALIELGPTLVELKMLDP